MLTNCPECQLQISDKAYTCPHCGYPLKGTKRPYNPSKAHKRLPNGFGQISQIKNKNLRNPYRVMVTVGKNPETGKPISKLLQPNAYFATYNDAYQALVEYNRKPYDLDTRQLTFKQVYEEWSKKHFENISHPTIAAHESAWNRMEMLHDFKMIDIRPRHLRSCMDNCEKDTMKYTIKTLANLIFDYAVENEYTDQNYSRNLKYKTDRSTQNEHNAFSKEELDKLWQNYPIEKGIDMILVQCYTGFRPQEIGDIRIENVDLKNWTIAGGMKTESGKNRIVPIHAKIRGIVKSKYKMAKHLGSEYLFNLPKHGAMKFTYHRYRNMFNQIMKTLVIENHRPHDPRKTFVTLAKKYNVNEYAIKMIVGHHIDDITENVYTERDPKWLMSEINKIKIDIPESVERVIGV